MRAVEQEPILRIMGEIRSAVASCTPHGGNWIAPSSSQENTLHSHTGLGMARLCRRSGVSVDKTRRRTTQEEAL